jgi:tetratricopeptide (TPR) repeat protein
MLFTSSAVVWILWLAAAASAADLTWEQLIDRGAALEAAGNYTGAAELYRAAKALAGQSRDLRLVQTLNVLANSEANSGRWAEAEREYRQALTVAAAAVGKQSPEYALVLTSLAVTYWESGDPERAEPLLRQAISLYLSTVAPDDAKLALARNSLGAVMLSKARYRQADLLLRQALAVFQRYPERYTVQVGATSSNLGVANMNLGHIEEARRLVHEAVEQIEKAFGPDHPLLIGPLNNLATVFALAGNHEAAKAALERAIDVAARRLGTEHPKYAWLLLNYAVFERKSGHKPEARKLEAKARSVLRQNARTNGVGMTVDASDLRPKAVSTGARPFANALWSMPRTTPTLLGQESGLAAVRLGTTPDGYSFDGVYAIRVAELKRPDGDKQ